MKITIDIINDAAVKHGAPVVAFSGGADSMVLLDIVRTHTNHPVTVVFADSQTEYPETLDFIKRVCVLYDTPLLIAKANRTPLEQWTKAGWPMLGKYAARIWNQKNKDKGFRCDVSSCCRTLKIAPARRLMKKHGFQLQLTGQKGAEDDSLRGLRAIKDGAIKYVKQDKITICNPLLGWTETMMRRYAEQNNLPIHPAKSRGAITIGCMFCGGGAQFTNSGFRVLRHTQYDQWLNYIVEQKAGYVILAIKYDKPLTTVMGAVNNLGGLKRLAIDRPWVFDFLRKTPIQGYER